MRLGAGCDIWIDIFTEVVCLGAIGAAEVVAKFRVRHVVTPRAALPVADGKAEALRAKGEVVQGQLRLGPERVRPDDQHVIPKQCRALKCHAHSFGRMVA